MILSNTSIQNVQHQVRRSALESFEFFANSVLASALPDDLCSLVQDALQDDEDVFIHTTRPRALGIAIVGWLGSRGVAVLSSVDLPQHEILQWLELQDPAEGPHKACSLDVQSNGVRVQWL